MPDRTLERFFSFVDKNGPVAANNPELGCCWIWTGGVTRGYGIFWAYGKSHRAHVFSYKTFVGEVPALLPHLDHFACDRTECVNFTHVRPDTARGNVLRSSGRAAVNRAKEACPAGHNYAEHGRINEVGARECVPCVRKRRREANAARRLAVRGGAEIPRATDTHCASGHPWTEESTYNSPRGTKICKICRRAQQAALRAAAAAKTEGT